MEDAKAIESAKSYRDVADAINLLAEHIMRLHPESDEAARRFLEIQGGHVFYNQAEFDQALFKGSVVVRAMIGFATMTSQVESVPTSEDVERVARAICQVDEQNGAAPWDWYGNDKARSGYFDQARAAIAALRPT